MDIMKDVGVISVEVEILDINIMVDIRGRAKRSSYRDKQHYRQTLDKELTVNKIIIIQAMS